MDEKILEQCKLLNRYVKYLEEISTSDHDQFISDFILKGSAERYFQLAIESCINIGNRILSIIQMVKPVKTPETYADIFNEIGVLGILPQDFINTMINMVRFRNRKVHMYWDIDPEQLYTILQDKLGDFDKFRQYVIDFLNKEHI